MKKVTNLLKINVMRTFSIITLIVFVPMFFAGIYGMFVNPAHAFTAIISLGLCALALFEKDDSGVSLIDCIKNALRR